MGVQGGRGWRQRALLQARAGGWRCLAAGAEPAPTPQFFLLLLLVLLLEATVAVLFFAYTDKVRLPHQQVHRLLGRC